MSLINQMLHDLDKRRRRGETNASKGIPIGVEELSRPVEIKIEKSFLGLHFSKRLALLLVLLIGMWISLFGWFYISKNPLPTPVKIFQQWKQMFSNKISKTSSSHSSSDYTELNKLLDNLGIGNITSVSHADFINPIDHIDHVEVTHQLIHDVLQTIPTIQLNAIHLLSQQTKTQLRLTLSEPPDYEISYDQARNEMILTLRNTMLGPQYQPDISLVSPIIHLRTSLQGNTVLIALQLAPNTVSKDSLIHDPSGLIELTIDFTPSAKETLHTNHETTALLEQVVKKARKLSPVEKANNDCAHALTLAEHHDITGAIALLKKILNNTPTFNDARETLVSIYIEQKQYQKAMEPLNIGLTTSPNNPVFIALKAQILMIQNRLEEAITLLESISPSINQHPEYYALLATLYRQTGEYLLSAKLYDELIKIQPDNGLWWLGKAIGLNAVGHTRFALHAYEHAAISANLTPQLHAYVDEQITKLK